MNKYMAVYSYGAGWGRTTITLSHRFHPDDAKLIETDICKELDFKNVVLVNLLPTHKWWQFWK